MPDRRPNRGRSRPPEPTRPQFAPRAPVTSAGRRVGQSPERQRFLIICEGEKTEPLYFRAFHLPGLVEVEAIGTGMNTLSLIAEAIRLREANKRAVQEQGPAYAYDQFWCVFDRDSFPGDAFNNAIHQAREAGFQVAYTNEAFELWYLLHFDYHDHADNRDNYQGRLTTKLGRPYRKSDATIYEILAPRQETALRNAARLRATYDPHNPQRDNPCTTVHELVSELRANASS